MGLVHCFVRALVTQGLVGYSRNCYSLVQVLFLGARLTYPIAFEAVLTAEEAIFALFLTCWTLQSAGVVGAVSALALPLWCLHSHISE